MTSSTDRVDSVTIRLCTHSNRQRTIRHSAVYLYIQYMGIYMYILYSRWIITVSFSDGHAPSTGTRTGGPVAPLSPRPIDSWRSRLYSYTFTIKTPLQHTHHYIINVTKAWTKFTAHGKNPKIMILTSSKLSWTKHQNNAQTSTEHDRLFFKSSWKYKIMNTYAIQ